MVNGVKRVLVFDSGVGGLSVFDAICAAGLSLELDYVGDNAWLPYGLKSDAALRERVPALLSRLCAQWTPDAVVIACNTASTIALEETRAALPVPVVGVVPPIKPAAQQSRTGVIGLLATPATIARAYTDELIHKFASDCHVIRFGSSALVEAAEAKLRGHPAPEAAITDAIAGLFSAPRGAEADVVALACTHFPLLAEELRAAAPRQCVWLDSGAAIARRVGEITQAPFGRARARNAAFTEPAPALGQALLSRGFSSISYVAEAPEFVCVRP